jgi:hypothetical protein
MITLTKEELADILAKNSILARSAGAIESILEDAVEKSQEGNDPDDYLYRTEKL